MTESDQLQPEDTLVDRGTDDILDEGISPPEKLRGSTAKGVTVREQAEGETIDERLAQEEPDAYAHLVLDEKPDPSTEAGDPADQSAGDQRSGRLVEPNEGIGEDGEKDVIADDVGIAGSAASAEEAAVHTREPE
jgi:hypothetical protein